MSPFRWIALILTLSLVGLATLAYWLNGLEACETSVRHEIRAPSINKVAIVFSRNAERQLPSIRKLLLLRLMEPTSTATWSRSWLCMGGTISK